MSQLFHGLALHWNLCSKESHLQVRSDTTVMIRHSVKNAVNDFLGLNRVRYGDMIRHRTTNDGGDRSVIFYTISTLIPE
jgi:hypothetical protein